LVIEGVGGTLTQRRATSVIPPQIKPELETT
jgi:hypothetical protein